MQALIRSALIWLLNITLAVALSLSLPAPWSAGILHVGGQESESYETERTERISMPPARVKQAPGVVSPGQTTALRGNTLPAPEMIILTVVCILFRPLIYKKLLRLWLEPLKFTSKFVAYAR